MHTSSLSVEMDKSIKLEHQKTTDLSIRRNVEDNNVGVEDDDNELVSRTDTAVTIPVAIPGNQHDAFLDN